MNDTKDYVLLQLWGAGAFGAIMGWFLYYINRYRSGDVQFSDLTTVIGTIGGAAILALFEAKSDLFGAYGIGLFVGFFAYFIVLSGLVSKSANFDADFFLDGRRKRPEEPWYIPSEIQSPSHPPMFHRDSSASPAVLPYVLLVPGTSSPAALSAEEIISAISILSVKTELEAQIAAGKIVFDPGKETKLKGELLGTASGVTATAKLQALVLAVSKEKTIRISDLVRTNSGSHHDTGRAVDIGNEEIASTLLPSFATDNKVLELNIDEIIFDASVAGQSDRNKWNYDAGVKHSYSAATLDEHKNHIHFAVTA